MAPSGWSPVVKVQALMGAWTLARPARPEVWRTVVLEGPRAPTSWPTWRDGRQTRFVFLHEKEFSYLSPLRGSRGGFLSWPWFACFLRQASSSLAT